MEIRKIQGTEPALYPLVGPLVMNPNVLKQNLNFPFRTTELFLWYIALEAGQVIGFIPLEHRGKDSIINNYYIVDHQKEVLETLIQEVCQDQQPTERLVAVSLTDDADVFEKAGFTVSKIWSRYIKLVKA